MSIKVANTEKNSWVYCTEVSELTNVLQLFVGCEPNKMTFKRCYFIEDENSYNFEQCLELALLGKDENNNNFYFWIPREESRLPFELGFGFLPESNRWKVMICRK